MLISNKVHFKVKKIVKDEGTLHNNKGSTVQEEITILNNVHAPNSITSEYMRQNLIELQEIHKSTIKFIKL